MVRKVLGAFFLVHGIINPNILSFILAALLLFYRSKEKQTPEPEPVVVSIQNSDPKPWNHIPARYLAAISYYCADGYWIAFDTRDFRWKELRLQAQPTIRHLGLIYVTRPHNFMPSIEEFTALLVSLEEAYSKLADHFLAYHAVDLLSKTEFSSIELFNKCAPDPIKRDLYTTNSEPLYQDLCLQKQDRVVIGQMGWHTAPEFDVTGMVKRGCVGGWDILVREPMRPMPFLENWNSLLLHAFLTLQADTPERQALYGLEHWYINETQRHGVVR